MIDSGKVLISIGVIVLIIGMIIWMLGRMGFHGLPGDIKYESKNIRVYFPWVTCLVLSAIFTAAMWLWNWLGRR